MEKIIAEFSDLLYREKFSDIFKREEWEMAVMKKKKGAKEQTTYYIGARYDQTFWEGVKGTKKQFLLRFEEDENESWVSFVHHGLTFTKKELKEIGEKFSSFLQKENADCYLIIEIGDMERMTKATGKKSSTILEMNGALIRKKNLSHWRGKYKLDHTDIEYETRINLKEGTLQFIDKKGKVFEMHSVIEMDEWLDKQLEDTVEIKKYMIEIGDMLKTKIKSDNIKVDERTIKVDRIESNGFEIIKMTGRKVKYTLNLNFANANYEMHECGTLEELKAKITERFSDYANKYRLRKVTGQKPVAL